MFRKAPSLLALLVTGGWLLAQAGGAQPLIAVDQPRSGQTVFGIVPVSGWVLDFNQVDKIEIFLDGASAPVNTAVLDLPRADVLEAFPTYANSATPMPGFITSFYAKPLADGAHALTILVTETTSATFLVGPISVFVDNTLNQVPFGYIDIPGASGNEGMTGSAPVTGWAIDDSGEIDHIDFLMDGQVVAGAVGLGLTGTAYYGSTRPDIYAAFKDVPNSLYTGFAANIDTTKLLDGVHVLSVRATDNLGATGMIGSRTVQVINNGGSLGPFGRIDFPLDKASLICSGTLSIPFPPGGCPSPCPPPGPPPQGSPSFLNPISGWALDVGARLDGGSVSYVELQLDGDLVANSVEDCIQIGQVLTGCYGLNRPDVARAYSGYTNADNSGFYFLFGLIQDSTGLVGIFLPGVNSDIPVAFTNSGAHTLSVRAGDKAATATVIGSISVDVRCDSSTSPDRPAFGYIDAPYSYQFINGLFKVFGWAYDLDGGVQRVDIDVDGQVQGSVFPPYLVRPDVPAADPRVPITVTAVGFTFLLDTTKLSDAAHDLVVYAVDKALVPHRTEIGRRKFVVLNNTAIKH